MTISIAKTKAEQALGEQFSGAVARLPGSGWVSTLRRDAIGRFAASGLPHRRMEEWKYTDLRERLLIAPPPADGTGQGLTAAAIDLALGGLARLTTERIVIADGAYHADLSTISLPAGTIEVKSLAATLAAAPAWLEGKFGGEGGGIDALNSAFMSDGVLLKVRAGQSTPPILLVIARSAAKPRMLTLRNVVSVEADAALTLVEVHVAIDGASAEGLTNIVTSIDVGPRGRCEHIKCAVESGDATHLSKWNVKIGKDARYRGFQLTASPALARNEIHARFEGEGAKLDLSGAFLARRREHIDTTLVVDHTVPGCESRELFKGVLDGDAHGIFQGKIIVRPGAQKTDGKQMSQALMLSPTAQFSSKPELEIYADDVVCGHGATCAELDENLIFYCRARGIPLDEARAILTESFIGEAIEKVETESLRDALMERAIGWLRTRDRDQSGA